MKSKSNHNNQQNTFVSYDPSFSKDIGKDYSYSIIAKTDAHEGPVYFKSTNELYFTTVPQNVNTPLEGYKKVSIKGARFIRFINVELMDSRASTFLSGHIPTADYLYRFKILESNLCRFCSSEIESISHLLLHCPCFVLQRHALRSLSLDSFNIFPPSFEPVQKKAERC